MKFWIVFGFGALGAAALTAFGSTTFSSANTAYFTFATQDGKGDMSYLCEVTDDLVMSEQTAQAAHAFFEAAIVASAQRQGKAMAAAMKPRAPSKEIIPKLEDVIAKEEANRRGFHRELQRRFGCVYRS